MPIRSVREAVSAIRWTIALAALLLVALAAPSAQANEVAIGVNASQYAVLYEGTGGNTLHITNGTINGNVGVGGTGKGSDSGPSPRNCPPDFPATHTRQISR